MPLVSFENLPQTPRTEFPPIIDDGSRTVYDPLWGYFTFGQRVTTQYNETETYVAGVSFTINGTFSRDAEEKASGIPFANDGEAFLALTTKMLTLQNMFANAAKQDPPDSIDDWYLYPNDSRVIRLPEPMLDRNNQRIVAMPDSISIGQSLFANYISYTATLHDVVGFERILIVNSIPVHQGAITAKPPKPILDFHRLIGGSGAKVYVKNYANTSVGVEGMMPGIPTSTGVVTGRCKELADSFQSGTLKVEVARRVNGVFQRQVLFDGYTIVSEPTFEARLRENGTHFRVESSR